MSETDLFVVRVWHQLASGGINRDGCCIRVSR